MSKLEVCLNLAAVAALIVFPPGAPAQEVKRGSENLLHRSPVEYPAAAIENKIEGTVVLEAKVDAKGVVRDARVISGPDELRAAAIKSVLDWHYSIEKGAPPIVEVAIEFKLPKRHIVPGPPPGGAGSLRSIDFQGVSGELKEKVLARLTLKEGDNLSGESYPQIVKTVQSVDEHLRVGFRTVQNSTRITISMPAASSADSKVIRVGGNAQQANLIQQPRPVYPPDAKKARIQGLVRMTVVIAQDGTVKNIELESGHPMLAPAAMDAVKQWVYRPTLLNGAPVEVMTTVDVNFTLAP